MMKIGIFKPTELNTGFSGNFWRMGTFILSYNESLPTDFGRKLEVKIQMYLYKDFDSYLNNYYSMATEWQTIYLDYSQVLNNAFDNILNELVTMENGYFKDCEIFDLSNPL